MHPTRGHHQKKSRGGDPSGASCPVNLGTGIQHVEKRSVRDEDNTARNGVLKTYRRQSTLVRNPF